MLMCDRFGLRPVEEEDLGTVWNWRNSERIRSVSLTDHTITWEEHLAWHRRSKRDNSRRSMLFECAGKPTGVVNFTEIDPEAQSATWGFYIGDPNAPKGSASAMGFLALDYAFQTLALTNIVGRCFASNQAGMRYHRRLGFREVAERRERVKKGDGMIDLLHLELTADQWQEVRVSLERKLLSEVDA